MIELTSEQRRALRAQAHHLNPVVSISQKGLQPTVLSEIDRCLRAHELIKVRLYGVERAEREGLITEICTAMGCAPVQHIGNLLVLWRPAPEASAAAGEAGKSALAGRRPGGKKPLTKKQAAVATEARRAAPKPAAKSRATPRRRARPGG